MRLESALEIIGALKRRFGEPMTVTDICRAVPLSYQPVYACVRWLEKRGVVSVRKRGQRLLCEPAATEAGAIWLALWSLEEARRTKIAALRELIAKLESRRAGIVSMGAIAAFDPNRRRNYTLYVTDAVLSRELKYKRTRLVSRAQLAEALVGKDAGYELARRIVPVHGGQLLWQIALARREGLRAAGSRARPASAPRRQPFID